MPGYEFGAGAANSKRLGEFLRRRRERLNPGDGGFPERVAERRVSDARRSQSAPAFSVDWYIRLEQHRDALPSRVTAEALSKALKLGPTHRAHLLRLASPETRRPFIKESAPRNLVALVEGLNTPAV